MQKLDELEVLANTIQDSELKKYVFATQNMVRMIFARISSVAEDARWELYKEHGIRRF